MLGEHAGNQIYMAICACGVEGCGHGKSILLCKVTQAAAAQAHLAKLQDDMFKLAVLHQLEVLDRCMRYSAPKVEAICTQLQHNQFLVANCLY